MRGDAFDRPAIWVRVDDRLIHGQVTVGWRQHLRYAEIWVVDDMVLADPYLQDALRLAAPADVQVRVYGVEEASALLASGVKRETSNVKREASNVTPRPRGREPSNVSPGGRGEGTGTRQVLLLVRSPEAALALVEGGAPLTQVNVGNVSARPGSVRVFKNISLTPAQAEALDALAGQGVSVTFQLAPEDARANWPTVRRRLAF